LRGDPILARPITKPERLWRWCKQNPRIPILSASLLVTVLVAYGIAWFWFESIYAQSDRALTSQALTNIEFTAESIAHTAGADLERYYTAVAQKAADPALAQPLYAIAQDEAWQKLSRSLSDPAISEEDAEPLRQQLDVDPLHLQVQEWVEELTIGDHLPNFAWFVQIADGLQIARKPLEAGGEKTIGRNYGWRAYFHGGEEDRPDSWRPQPNEHVKATHLSPPFVSRYTNEWVVVVTSPVYHEGQFVGVLGVMLRLGSFAELPGKGVLAEGAALDHRFAVLLDSRGSHAGQILQHPLYYEVAGAKVAPTDLTQRRLLLDHSQDADMRVASGDWVVNDNYRDPFATADEHYDRRWLAARHPVEVRGRPTGLHVLVQESYDEIIGSGLGKLRSGLTLLSLVTLGLAAAMVVPAWVIILRLVR
jgi:hypothetical protein